ncbi:MAG: DUF222 domain-containing protein [Actinomycetota bacterium]
MSTLRSALEEYRAAELRFFSDGQVEDDLSELRRAAGVIEAECARRVAEVERRQSFARDGYLSVTSWVEHRFQTTWSDAARQVRLARALEHMPATREALSEGEVSSIAVGQLVAARDAAPEEFVRAENTLLEAARTLPVGQLKRAVEHWKEAVDSEAAAREAADRFDRRGLHISPTFEGMVLIDGNLDPETGQTVISAIRAKIDAGARSGVDDHRTLAQRRADALGEICMQSLGRSDRPAVGGERPHVTVTVDLEALEGRAGYRCELDDAGGLSPEDARRIACDAGITRVITRGRSEPLELGRRTLVVPSAIRRALVIRDRGCRTPGTDRPPPWCDAHHGAPSAQCTRRRHSKTRFERLVSHHRVAHDRFSVEMTDAGPVFRRPDGTALEDRAPP